MSMVGLRVPEEAARVLWAFYEAEYDRPGDPVPLEDAHVTLLHLGDSLPKEMYDRAIEATLRATADVRPFTVATSRIRTFGHGDDGTPIVCQIDSEPLHALHQRLAETFDAAGVPFSKKHPEFKPHVTLAFSPDPLVDELFGSYSGFSPVEWGVHEVTLWGGDGGLRGPSESFPLSVVPRLASYRLAVRKALRAPLQAAPRR